MDSWELLRSLATEQDKAEARKLIGPKRLQVLLAKAALEGSSEKLDADEVAKFLGISKRSGRRKTRKNPPEPRQ